MNIIIKILVIVLFCNQTESQQVFCNKNIFDDPAKENNFLGSIFNYEDDIYVERNDWIWKFKKTPNEKAVRQVDQPMKTHQLFPSN